MKYLELFKNGFDETITEKIKPENGPYVGYSPTEGLMLTEILKEDEIDLTAGYVDLGLSVMWASCNLGASNPEELGEKYKWGETDEHKTGEKEYTENPNAVEHSYSYYLDAVTVSMKDNPYTKYLHYRIPTAELWQELIDNTTREVYTNSEGRNICKYTSNINGNFILLPLLMQTEGNNEIYYKTTTPSSLSGKEYPNGTTGKIIRIYSESSTTGVVSDSNDTRNYQNNYVRGVCSYPPKTDIIQYGSSISSDSTFVLTSSHSIEITCHENFTVYFSTTPDFIPDTTDENIVGSYKAQKDGNNYYRQISCQELSFGQSKHDYLYARFTCNQATKLTPALWNTTSCIDKTILISSGETISVPASSDTLYRMIYKDWVNYGYSIRWSGRSTLVKYVAAYCGFEHTDPDILKAITVPARKVYNVDQSIVDSWSSSLGTDGFIFVRLRSSMNGEATITSAKPADV